MKKAHLPPGKISEHFKGIGTVTRDQVVERAREIALTNGRGPNHYNQEDFETAKRELTGEEPLTNTESEEETVAGLVTWDEPPGAAGGPVPREEMEDERSAPEELVEQGMSEADHEQRVQSIRNRSAKE